MKIRKIHTKIWRDTWFSELSRASKLVFMYLITNDYIGFSGYVELPDRQICFDTGVTQTELEQCKKELAEKVKFYKDWLLVINFERFDPIKGENNNLWKAYNKEIEAVPEEIKKELEAPPKGLTSPLAGTNGIGNGNGIGIVSLGKSENPFFGEIQTIKKTTKVGSNKPTEKQMEEIAKKYNVPLSFVLSKWEDVCNWEEEKPGRMRGRNWRLTLMNWVKRDAIKIRQEQNDKRFGKSKIAFIKTDE